MEYTGLEENTQKKSFSEHTLKLENRKTMSVTGVTDVDGFDEHTIVLATSYGMMTIEGSSLHISKLNVEEGFLSVDGAVSSIRYSDADMTEKGGILSRLFR